MKRMKILFVADDFTGASDTLATLSRAGLKARLYPRVPDLANDADAAALDAIGIATGLRGMGPREGRAAMEELAAQLAAIGADFTHFKVCSTFDSAPDTGNICAVVDVLAQARKFDWVAIVGGQPSLSRYCLFGTLFAAAADGTVHRIDRHPVMKTHPTTPMGEADLRFHLARQGWNGIGLVDFRCYGQGAAKLADQIFERIAKGETRTLLDVSSQTDLALIGAALHIVAREKTLLCIGASSVAEALASQSQRMPAAKPAEPVAFDGPVFALAGSRSSVTADQISHAQRYDVLTIDPADLAGRRETDDAPAGRCAALLSEGRHVLLAVSGAQSPVIGGRSLAEAVARLAADVLSRVRPGCVVLAGGDTSSATISALGIESISFVADIDRGVPLVELGGGDLLDRLPMVLKGGQMGGPTLFDDLARLSVSCLTPSAEQRD